MQLLADVLTVGKYVRAGKNVDMLVGRIRRRLPDIPVGEARVAVESYLERVVAPLNKG